ncbi:hypothetical protein BCR39DRAFT_587470 [Naematelia encephala]|uniref:SMP-LTD domain-containing protein n=1 Tax=Naematelia encephala TaxID=71784 RepID=A0A1Y2BA26_9TREE|nr:hypothetical protein BCR39DRAFT_587470 [Naematelia encephala]
MCGFFYHLYLYLLGAVTGFPIFIILALGLFVKYGTTPIGDDDPSKLAKNALRAGSEDDDQKEFVDTDNSTPGKRIEGWLVIRESFFPRRNGTSFFGTSGSKAANGSNLSLEGDDEDDKDIPSITNTPTNGSTTSVRPADSKTSVNTAASAWGQIKNYATTRSSQTPTELFYAVLKGKVLYLYDDDKQGADSLKGVIGVENYNVSVETPDGPFEGRDGQMFAKRNALCLRRVTEDGEKRLTALSKGMESIPAGGSSAAAFDSEAGIFYLFSKNNSKMEDFYLALTAVSFTPSTTQNIVNFADILALVDVLRTEPEPIPAHWLNAMLSRVWFSLYQTKAVEQLIIDRIMKKLSKVKLPSTLEPITVREVNLGTFPPIFSKPMLKNLTKEGDAEFAVHMNYAALPNQPFRITIKTAWHPGISSLSIHLVLAVVVRSISGDLTIKIKPPPSNRVWYGFTSMPKIDYDIVPIMNDRKVTPDVVLNLIKTRFEDVIRDSIVKENMDDIAFFDTSPYAIRGGIFDDAHKRYVPPVSDEIDDTNGGIDVMTSNEDPSSATPETSGLRHRHPDKSRTLAIPPTSGISNEPADDVDSDKSFTRTETAPASLANGSNTHGKKMTATQLRSWLTSASASVVPHKAAAEGSSRMSMDGSGARSHSVERVGGGQIGSHASIDAESKQRRASMISRPSVESSVETSSGAVTPVATSNTPDSASSPLLVDTAASVPAAAVPTGKPDSPSSSKLSLISSIRTGDKKALASQVGLARDNVKKWGANWAAAKRQRFKTDEDSERPAAHYRPPEDYPVADAMSARQSIENPGTTLQERLAAATSKAGTASVAIPTNRGRSGSGASTSSSRVSLLSTSHTSVGHPSATLPPKWALAESKPTTEIHNAAASGSSIPNPTTAHARTGSLSTVSMQPHAGRTMVVPRVPKRPGEVTGLGNHPTEGMTRRISAGEQKWKDDHNDTAKVGNGERHDPPEEVHAPPPLPIRQSEPRPTENTSSNGGLGDSASLVPHQSTPSLVPDQVDEVTILIPHELTVDPTESKATVSSPPIAEHLARSDSAPSTTTEPPYALSTTTEPPPTALDGIDDPLPSADIVTSVSRGTDLVDSHAGAGHISQADIPAILGDDTNLANQAIKSSNAQPEEIETPSNAAEALRQALHKSEEASVIQNEQ